MRRRSTFIHSPSYDFNPADMVLKGRRLQHSGIKAAREEKLTFGFDKLPAELAYVLGSTNELHIRWSPESSPGSITPFLSRTTPGLHVSYIPKDQKVDGLLCPSLKKIFSNSLRCESHEASFSSPDQSTPWLKYYSLLPSLNQFVAYIQRDVCSRSDQGCFYDAELLNVVDYIDLDYDGTSRKLTLSAFWSKQPPAIRQLVGGPTNLDQWPLDISSAKHDKVEVGVFSSIPPVNPNELQLGGFLTEVGEDDHAKPTQFSFPSRHRILSRAQAAKQAYTVAFQKPTGLHPILEISFPSILSLEPPTSSPADSECTLHAYMTLPSSIFADEYAFTAKDPLFEQSHNFRSLQSISGELDLEAPDYVVRKWGSAMLLELAIPGVSETPIPDAPWNVTIPLHVRYLPPATGGSEDIRFPWPVVFWACKTDEDNQFSGNPFDRVNLGYDSLFDPTTMFYHLKPSPRPENAGQLIEVTSIPVLDTSRVGGDTTVERATLIVILLGFGWVLFKLWPGIIQQLGGKQRPNTANAVEEKKKKKKKQ